MTKPPLGIMPRHLFEEFRSELSSPVEFYSHDFERWINLNLTIARYLKAKLSIQFSWLCERNTIRYWRLYNSINLN